MTTLGRLADDMQFGDMILRADTERRIIRLRDVAKIELGALAYDQVCTLDTQPSVALSIYQRPGSNALETAQQVRDKMDELKNRFPEGVDYAIVYDTTPFIQGIGQRSVLRPARRRDSGGHRGAGLSCKAGGPRSFRWWPCRWRSSAPSPRWSRPDSVLNTLTLFGLVLAVGIVVDDAIVVVEAIEHHIEEGLSPRDAAIQAMEQVAGPVIAVGLVLTRRVRAVRVYLGRDRAVLPTVRRDDRHFDDHFGVQFADAQPGAGRAACCGRGRAGHGEALPRIGLVIAGRGPAAGYWLRGCSSGSPSRADRLAAGTRLAVAVDRRRRRRRRRRGSPAG